MWFIYFFVFLCLPSLLRAPLQSSASPLLLPSEDVYTEQTSTCRWPSSSYLRSALSSPRLVLWAEGEEKHCWRGENRRTCLTSKGRECFYLVYLRMSERLDECCWRSRWGHVSRTAIRVRAGFRGINNTVTFLKKTALCLWAAGKVRRWLPPPTITPDQTLWRLGCAAVTRQWLQHHARPGLVWSNGASGLFGWAGREQYYLCNTWLKRSSLKDSPHAVWRRNYHKNPDSVFCLCVMGWRGPTVDIKVSFYTQNN